MAIDYKPLLSFLQRQSPERFSLVTQDLAVLSSSELQKELYNLFGEENIVKQYAQLIAQPYIDLAATEVNKSLLFEVPENSMRLYKFIPFKKEGNTISIALTDVTDYNVTQAIKFVFQGKGLNLDIYLASETAINSVLATLKNMSAEVKKSLEEIAKTKEDENQRRTSDSNRGQTQSITLESAPIIKMVSVIVKNAVEGGASDIHIEGAEKNVRVRFRVDGILHTSLVLPKDVYSAIVARIKILSNLKIDEQRKPQDGRFSIVTDGGKKIDFRVSTFPTEFGEKVVLRILDTSQGIKSLEDLGFIGPKTEFIEKARQKPHGVILVTGPTGSGKSTTLYTLLSLVNSEEINIVTLEDPIEYYLEGVNQSQVKPEIGYTFASGLRSILRQDPDIIMVGEIRDGETAGLAVQSALTGHLVLSTLHTNDSVGAIPRLMNMGVETFLLSASLNLVLAQRLARKLCVNCKKQVPIAPELKTYIINAIKDVKDSYIRKIYKGDFTSIYEPVGCDQCTNGYKGRMCIFELIYVDEELQFLIEKSFDEEKVLEYLRRNEFVNLKQDGIFKVLNGYISLEELLSLVEQ